LENKKRDGSEVLKAVKDSIDINLDDIKKAGDMIMRKLFREFDHDQSGYIDFNEFTEMTKSMGLFIKTDELVKLYATVDRKGVGQIGYDQFKECIYILQGQIGRKALEKAGLTVEDLTMVLSYAIFTLLLILVFIFLGIAAFSTINPFSGVINSLFPVAAGLMKKGSQNVEGITKQVKGVVDRVIAQIRDDE
jgi:hypothetical protein